MPLLAMMMMIAFITQKSSSLPFIEGLCSSKPCVLKFSVLFSRHLLIIFGRNNMFFKKKQLD